MPELSLLLQKATAELPHGGGTRFDKQSAEYQMLLRWIQQGSPRKVEGEPTLDAVELARTKFTLRPNESQSLQVTARYSDGSTRNVTHLTSYLANESAVVAVKADGQITAGALPGETAVMARYMNHICVANVVIPQTRSIDAAYFAGLPDATLSMTWFTRSCRRQRPSPRCQPMMQLFCVAFTPT